MSLVTFDRSFFISDTTWQWIPIFPGDEQQAETVVPPLLLALSFKRGNHRLAARGKFTHLSSHSQGQESETRVSVKTVKQ